MKTLVEMFADAREYFLADASVDTAVTDARLSAAIVALLGDYQGCPDAERVLTGALLYALDQTVERGRALEAALEARSANP